MAEPGINLPQGRFTVDDFMRLAVPKQQGEVVSAVKAPFAGQMPDITAAQVASYGGAPAAMIAAYVAGMSGVDFYVFCGCLTVLASIFMLTDKGIRGERNRASATNALNELLSE